jgi:hypothetical protein
LSNPCGKVRYIFGQFSRHFIKRYGFDNSAHVPMRQQVVFIMYVCMYVINTTTTTTTTVRFFCFKSGCISVRDVFRIAQ